ncbi:MAG: bifunctional hydroxymethylpyrimidine kinase/phosphomethylpyrimidine kinase, partial [Meiothermus sp.]|nr:bifunctional hydroxymethylpyrimidine kinase/phosphomethylpyrimidine kinase [Meiothermus sp.]
PLEEAVAQAKAYLTRALETAPPLGRGHGPLNHWA